MRALWLAALVACGGSNEVPYDFRGSIDPNGTVVTLNGDPNKLDFTFHFDSYDDARSLQLSAIATYNGQTVETVLSPGFCEDAANEDRLDLGDLKVEDLDYVVATSLTVAVIGAQCFGTKNGFIQSP
jgi:hypothetical protein